MIQSTNPANYAVGLYVTMRARLTTRRRLVGTGQYWLINRPSHTLYVLIREEPHNGAALR